MKHFPLNGVIRILGEKDVRPGSKGSRQWQVLKQFNGKTVEDFHQAAQLSTRLKPQGTYQTSNWWVRELDYCWNHGVIKVEVASVAVADLSTPGDPGNLSSESDQISPENNPMSLPDGDVRIGSSTTSKGIWPTAHPDLRATGIYMAYPTTSVLKPIYRGYATKVNNEHTKVGMAQDSFHARKRGYLNTFDGEVEFIPIAEVTLDVLAAVEQRILDQLSQHFVKVGRAREWFATSDHEKVVKIVKEVLRSQGQSL
jgi:hypothetical protein